MLGSTSRGRMRKREQPAHQRGATKSRLRTCMVVERATTAKRSHSSRPSVSIRMVIELPSRPTTASATSTTGQRQARGDGEQHDVVDPAAHEAAQHAERDADQRPRRW